MGILSGLGGLGLGDLENLDIFEEEEKAESAQKASAAAPEILEKDLVYDKSYQCPVCDGSFTAKIMKTGKAKMVGTDFDLRTRYDCIDAGKYDVILCPHCGYAALSRYFPTILPTQVKMIKEKISSSVRVTKYNDEIYSYEEAMERYKLALVNAVVKRGKSSERAYICLKSAWLLRGYAESLQQEGKADAKTLAELAKQENEYLGNAYKGFVDARQTENFPMCGMDELTVDYLLAALAARFKKYDVASKLLAGILTNPAANNRVKEKARELKEQILEDLRKK